MNYRLYSFVNFYLSSIQQGVQTAHLVAELFNDAKGDQKKVLRAWSETDKTIIILNGGACRDINEKLLFLSKEAFSWHAPVSSFSEDTDSLNGIMTCCGIIVPEYVWGSVDYKTALWKKIISSEAPLSPADYFFQTVSGLVHITKEGTADHMLITMMKSCRLAQ